MSSTLLAALVVPLAAPGYVVPLAAPSYDTKTLDCGYHQIAYEYALKIQPWLDAETQKHVYDSLSLDACGHSFAPTPATRLDDHITEDAIHVVSSASSQHGDGSAARPYPSIYAALRRARRTGQRTIALGPGIHFLNETITLTPADNNLTITAKPGADAWISGGVLLPSSKVKWERATEPHLAALPVWKADVSSFLLPGHGVDGLFTATLGDHRRMTRARYPNGDVEHIVHGSHLNGKMATTWQFPPSGPLPTFTYVDLSVPGNPSGVVKDDSTMAPYNAYATGKGGICDTVWDTSHSGSYWCSR